MQTSEIPLRKLSVREAARYLGLSKSWLDKKRLEGGGPPYMKFARRVVYDLRDLESWAAEHRRRSTSDMPQVSGSTRRECRPA